jgi:hypothetical protein
LSPNHELSPFLNFALSFLFASLSATRYTLHAIFKFNHLRDHLSKKAPKSQKIFQTPLLFIPKCRDADYSAPTLRQGHFLRHRQSCDRLIGALLLDVHEEWQAADRPYLNILNHESRDKVAT